MPFLNFSYANPTKIIFGKGQISKLAKSVPKDKVIFMTYGGGSIKRNGVYDQVKTALADRKVVEFGGIEANPDYETLCKAVQMVKEIGPEKVFLLPVGGGSVIDGSKFIAAASVYDHSDNYWDILETGGKFIKSTIPLGTVLTLPAVFSTTCCFLFLRQAVKVTMVVLSVGEERMYFFFFLSIHS